MRDVADLRAEQIGDAVKLSWRLDGPVDAVTIERTVDESSPVRLPMRRIRANAGQYVDSAVQPGVTYCYQIYVEFHDVDGVPARTSGSRTTVTVAARPRADLPIRQDQPTGADPPIRQDPQTQDPQTQEQQTTVSYTVARAGWRRRTLRVQVRADGVPSELVLIARSGTTPPQARGDGQVLARMSAHAPAREHSEHTMEVSLDGAQLPWGVRLFPGSDGMGVVLQHPPDDALVVR